MKTGIWSLCALFFILSCGRSMPSGQEAATQNADSLGKNKGQAGQLPYTDGVFRFEISYAGYLGKSFGDSVDLEIKSDSLRVIFRGESEVTTYKNGDLIEEGRLILHKSGQWIIGNAPSDAQVEEIGGCSGGPAIVDFIARKYKSC